MQKNNGTTKKICACGALAALSFVLDLFAILLNTVFPAVKLPLSALPIIVGAVFYGPLWGAAVGFVGSLLGQILSYGLTPTTLLWVLPAAVRGLSIGLLFIAFKRSMKYPVLALEISISALMVTAVNTAVMYIDSKIYGYYSFAYVFGGLLVRVITGIAAAFVFAVIVPPIIKFLKKTLHL